MTDQDKEQEAFEAWADKNGYYKSSEDLTSVKNFDFPVWLGGFNCGKSNSSARIAELEALAAEMADALRSVIRECPNDHYYWDEAKSALKKYEAMKGGA